MSTDRPTGLVLGAATLATGLLAGLFYAYACSVMPGLARTDDRAFVEAMQQINEAILNPVFALSFFGAPVLTAAAAVLAWRSGSGEATRWIVAAVALSVAAFAVTIGLNVPLNDDLAIAGDPNRVADRPAYASGSRTGGWPGTSFAPSRRQRRWPASPARWCSTDS